MNDHPRLAAGIVLAGGKSSRMGRDKSLLRLGGKTLLRRTTGVLAEVFGEVLIVADRADRFNDLAGVRVVADLVPDIGPLGGIYTGLKETARPSAFVVACDMPLLDPRVIAGQVDVWRTADADAGADEGADEGADALVPVLNGEPEPLHSIYSERCLPAIERQIERGEYRVRALFDAVRVHFWEPDPADARCFANINTPADWAEFTGTGGPNRC